MSVLSAVVSVGLSGLYKPLLLYFQNFPRKEGTLANPWWAVGTTKVDQLHKAKTVNTATEHTEEVYVISYYALPLRRGH